MELRSLIRRAASRLAAAGIPSPHADAELLAAHVWGVTRGDLQLRLLSGLGAREDDHEAQARFRHLIDERANRVPLQHLTGVAPFRWLELRVGPGVFVPRPETETVVELVLKQLHDLMSQGVRRPRVVDLGTGSGAIAASIAVECPAAEVHAVEVSADAAAWAELNFRSLPAAASAVTLHCCDLRDFAQHWGDEQGTATGAFDIVVSNPPYIPPHMVPVEQEVREHDPEIALYGGGPDGLELPEAVIRSATELLAPGGWLVLEHAEVQADALAEHCSADPLLSRVETHLDLTGRARATSAVLQHSSAGADRCAAERTA